MADLEKPAAVQNKGPYVRRLGSGDEVQVVALFAAIARDPARVWFHPHPFTSEQAWRIVCSSQRDIYLGLFMGTSLIGYGMLRGWEAGFEVPSLGIYLLPFARRTGLSGMLMRELHLQARKTGAECIRLKVSPGNTPAVRLYERLGYVFVGEEEGQLVGYLDLPAGKES